MWRIALYLHLAIMMNLGTADDQCTARIAPIGTALKGFVFKKINVTGPYMCDVECEQERICQSYNYNIKEKICELNNRTKEARRDHFQADPARFYAKRLNGRVPLGTIQELPAESCVEILRSEGANSRNDDYWLDLSGNGKAQKRYCDISSIVSCSAPLGMEDYRITSAQISASSQYNGKHAPNQGRLHFKEISGSLAGSWAAGRNNVYQWFQVDLTIETTVKFLATQGRNMYEQWVTKYKLQYSNDGSTFQVFKQDGESSDKVFVGNSDRDTVVKNPVISPIKARYFRLIPTEWHNHISMRIELYGCLENMRALGIESGTITDSQLTASSIWDVYHSPARARLHTKDLGLSKGIGAWSSLTNDLNQWLQVDLGKITSVTYIATQGRNGYSTPQWVKKYKLQFSNDGVSFLFYQRQGDSSDVVFEGNIDRDTVVYHLLDPPITARFLRVKPTEWQSHISMRLELYTSPEKT